MASGCFDLLAADYDRTWTHTPAGCLQRDAVWRHMLTLFRPGDHVLDLGCGTGEDALRLVRGSVRVRGLDASPEMVRIARARGVCAEVGNIEDIGRLEDTFDGVISNFGALNCVENIAVLRSPLARLVRRGGHLAFCTMSRFCGLESLHYLRRLQFRKAMRRWSGETYAARLGLKVFYPSGRQIKRALEPEFQLVSTIGIGVTIPPSYVQDVPPASLRLRARIDEYIEQWPWFRAIADHQLFLFVRT
jgi:ubiquinone/menaquinone biosynthesis C-methylase UbiE